MSGLVWLLVLVYVLYMSGSVATLSHSSDSSTGNKKRQSNQQKDRIVQVAVFNPNTLVAALDHRHSRQVRISYSVKADTCRCCAALTDLIETAFVTKNNN